MDLPYDLRSHNPKNHILGEDFFYNLQYAHSVKLILAVISPHRSHAKSDAAATLTADYLARASRFLACEAKAFDSNSRNPSSGVNRLPSQALSRVIVSLRSQAEPVNENAEPGS